MRSTYRRRGHGGSSHRRGVILLKAASGWTTGHLLLLLVAAAAVTGRIRMAPRVVEASRLSLVRHALLFGKGNNNNNSTSSAAAVVRPQDKKTGELSSSKEMKFLEQQKHHYVPTIMERLRGGARSTTTTATRIPSSSSSSRREDLEESRSAVASTKRKFGRKGRHFILAYYSSTGRTATRSIQRSSSSSSLVRPSALPQIIVRGGSSRGVTLSEPMSLLQMDTSSVKPSSTTVLSNSKTPVKRTLWTAVACTLIYTLVTQRHVWVPVLTNKQVLQDTTLSVLHRLTPSDTDPSSAWLRTYLLYGCGMAVWEFCGLSTIPVETAAGMVLGWPAGAVASLAGKLCGACTAYALGRRARDWVLQNVPAVQQSTLLQLLLHSNNNDSNSNKSSRATDMARPPPYPPLLTTFLMKFSCFPELLKNLGSSLIPVVEPWMFVLATVLHGGTFTLVWTWLGVDTAARLHQTDLPRNVALQATLVGTFILGVVITPMVMIWWMRDLQRQSRPRPPQQQQRGRRSHEGIGPPWRRIQWFGSSNPFVVSPQPSAAAAAAAASWLQPVQTATRQWNDQVVAYLRDTTIAELCLVVGLVCALLVHK